ncbi:PREDICTED: uncharacterized protein At1g24000-like [Camelina sativa]|uniref:Uncharacterized protein At1g24000-like n=1 Tax=Camelina sativa TaxID=90675 RepID=A0ABM0VRQ8_CAMSA|nr:PREDICTED: uncharacterized protein At1g24000-like [Camelina sativa]
MALHGTWYGELDIKSQAARFFKSFTDDIISPTDRIAEEEFESIDSEKRTVTIKMSGCLISEKYKSVKATITVTPKEDGDGSQVGGPSNARRLALTSTIHNSSSTLLLIS